MFWSLLSAIMSQFLRELHFIEAIECILRNYKTPTRRSSFGNCTSLRLGEPGLAVGDAGSQFLRELHFIEATAR